MSSVASVAFEGRKSHFATPNPDDHISAYHVQGRFYEVEQLEIQRHLIPMRSTILDIGANVGNHTIFYAMHTWADRVYAFEANAKTVEILRENTVLNSDYRAQIDLSFTGFAVSNSRQSYQVALEPEGNLGATQFKAASPDADSDQSIAGIVIDDLDLIGHISFIKIDVEGMELDVLDGCTNTIAKFRPTLAVEVSDKNSALFWQWVGDHNYHVINAFCDYLFFKTYIAIPK